MNITRGLFRLWLIFSAVFVIAVGAISFSDIKKKFDKASMDFSQHGTLLLPVDCSAARGTENADYTTDTSSAYPKC